MIFSSKKSSEKGSSRMSWSFARSSRKSSEKGESKLGKKPSSPNAAKGLKWTNSAIKTLVSSQCNYSEKSEVEDRQNSRSKAAKSLHAKEVNTKKVVSNHQNSQIKEPFPVILYDILEKASTDSNIAKIVSWHPDGIRFRVHDRAAFETLIQPVHFPTQSDFASFRRQLNLYDYKRISKDLKEEDGYYFHPKFMRGKRPLCYQMCRNLATTKMGRMKKKKSRFLKNILSRRQFMQEHKKRRQDDGSSTSSLTRATNNMVLSCPLNQQNLSSNQSLAVGITPTSLHTNSVSTAQSTVIGASVNIPIQSIHTNGIDTFKGIGSNFNVPTQPVPPLQVPTSNNTDGLLNTNNITNLPIGTDLNGLNLKSLSTAQIKMLADTLKQMMNQQLVQQQQVQTINSTNLTSEFKPSNIQSIDMQPQPTKTYVTETDSAEDNSNILLQPFHTQASILNHSRPGSAQSSSGSSSQQLSGRSLQQRSASNLIAIKQLTNDLSINDDTIYAPDDYSVDNESLKSSRTLNTASEESSKGTSHCQNKRGNYNESFNESDDTLLNELLTKQVSTEDSALFFQNALAWVDNISKVD